MSNIWKIWFPLINIHLWQAAHCTLLTTHCNCIWTFTCTCTCLLHTTHCTPHVYTACFTCITSHCKHPKFAWVAFKIYIAKLTLIFSYYWTQHIDDKGNNDEKYYCHFYDVLGIGSSIQTHERVKWSPVHSFAWYCRIHLKKNKQKNTK